MGWLDTIGTVVGIAGTVKGIVGKPKAAPSAAGATRVSKNVEEISRMLRGGMSDPEFARLVGEGEGDIRKESIEAVNRYFTQARREKARTGVSAINEERRDEAAAAALAEQFEGAKAKARASTRELLTAAATANQIAIGGFAKQATEERAGASQDFARLVEGLSNVPDSDLMGNISSAASDIGKLFGGGTTTPTYTGTTDDSWLTGSGGL